MLLRLIAPLSDGSRIFATDPANRGFELGHVLALLSRLEAAGDTVEILDGELVSADQLAEFYMHAIEPVMVHKVPGRIKEVFGSRDQGMGPHFGLEVAALIVYEDGRPVDVYPREDGELVRTITDFLEDRVAARV